MSEEEGESEELDRSPVVGPEKKKTALSPSLSTHLAQDVSAQDGLGDALVLDCCALLRRF